MKSSLTRVVDDVIALKMKAVDDYIESVVEPIENVGNPEKLIGKPYETWTQLDLQLLGQIYGNSNDSPLAKLIFNKEYEAVRRLEET